MTNISIAQLESRAKELREQLEQLLENSQDESAERKIIELSLNDLAEFFEEADHPRAANIAKYGVTLVPSLSEFGNGPAEKTLLRFCLQLEGYVESAKLGATVDDRFFDSLLLAIQEQDKSALLEEPVDTAALKILRMYYQSQLIALIKGEEIQTSLTRVEQLVGDIMGELPLSQHNSWALLRYYVEQLEESNLSAPLDRVIHQILGQMDQRLAALLNYQVPTKEPLPLLLEEVQKSADGVRWIGQNLKSTDIYITAGVYARFAEGIKDEIIELHESMERIYLDESQVDKLPRTVEFLEELATVLRLMGREQMALLTRQISAQLDTWVDENGPDNRQAFNHTVNLVWILEQNLQALWKSHDDEIPLTNEDVKEWALLNSYRALNQELVKQYETLHGALTQNEKSEEEVREQLSTLLSVDAQGNPHELVFKAQKDLDQLDHDDLAILLLALSYIASRKVAGLAISAGVIEQALTLFPEFVEVEEEEESADGEKAEQFQISELLLGALKEETTELEGIYLDNIKEVGYSQMALEELVRVAHTLKANLRILKLDELLERVNALESYLLGLEDGSERDGEYIDGEFKSIFMQIKAHLFEEL